MKVNVEFDMTPEEFRRALGFPDVQQFQAELMKKVLEKMEAGEEGYDPFNLMQPFIKSGFQSMEGFQKLMMESFAHYMDLGKPDKPEG